MSSENEHIPVLLSEVISGLNIRDGGIYVDLTLGRAGHSKEILKRIPHGHLYGFDQDPEALTRSKEVLEKSGGNWTTIHANFAEAAEKLESLGINKVDGILMDLGVSSPQFDEADRGFSYRYDALLDMRMDPSSMRPTAYDIVNTFSLEALTKIFRDYGEEKFAYSIAQNIIRNRTKKPIVTTNDLVGIIKNSKPDSELRKKGHPAKQTFQALRIAVNDELNVLRVALEKCIPLLNSGGRIAVITFQSLEDRIVKEVFKNSAVVIGDKRNPFQTEKEYRLVNRKVIVPSQEEVLRNRRSTSAKLRILERK
ncbi:MAG TPA: 16S rRNA (cytosine(1402)-N(4))-methyltransferase RsmH [Bacilli bacterium]|nr:16S rRNA (cytosine(1402)-N(4))-methyltransferase RsmH [Bacilli bacterium]